jgi:hypothetical protein
VRPGALSGLSGLLSGRLSALLPPRLSGLRCGLSGLPCGLSALAAALTASLSAPLSGMRSAVSGLRGGLSTSLFGVPAAVGPSRGMSGSQVGACAGPVHTRRPRIGAEPCRSTVPTVLTVLVPRAGFVSAGGGWVAVYSALALIFVEHLG